MWNWIFIMLTYAHMNMKKNDKAKVRSCLRLMLNGLKEMNGLIFIYIPLGT